MKALALALGLCVSLSAFGWESVCRQYPDTSLDAAALQNGQPCTPEAGTNTARQRWVGPLDEHRQLFVKTLQLAGIPDVVNATVHLRVFTANATVASGTYQLPSLAPVDFTAAERAQSRSYSPAELAQLPDFSYSLWDWANAHESCPLPGVSVDAESCHDFASHMGPVNANHFLPLSRSFYVAYHELALSRAAECKAMLDALGTDVTRFTVYTHACQAEALTLEAVGQHYLQDSFSMGHMWQRWGSPDLSDFPGATDDEKREKAVLIALFSGLLHGSRGVLQKLPDWSSYDVNDALCAPNDAVAYTYGGADQLKGVGDDYLSALPQFGGDNEFGAQSQKLFQCAISGALAVYQAAGSLDGPAQPTTGFVSVDPEGDGCFGQRATNEAMLTAAAVNLKVAGKQLDIPLDSTTVGWMLPKVATSQGDVPVSNGVRAQFRLAAQRFVSLTRLYAKQSPNGTDVADGALGDFMGVSPNGVYAQRPALSSYVDPPLPWTGAAGADPKALILSRVFHRAHAKEWCEALDGNALAALKTRVSSAALDAEGKAAACEACAEFTVRHLRIGTDATAYDATREPLCHDLTPSPAYVYQPGSAGDEPLALAHAYCGCP